MLSVKISTNLRVNAEGAYNYIRLTNGNLISELQDKAVEIYKSESPVRTGRFRSLVIIKNSSRRESGGITQGFATIGSAAPHAKYVVKKTKPSRGAYVPALDARIQFGQHPGTRANNVVSRTVNRLRFEAQRIADKYYGKGRFDIVRFIKGV